MSAMASLITGSRLFTPPFLQARIKENIKAPHHWSWNSPVNFPCKGSETRKMFPFSSWYQNWASIWRMLVSARQIAIRVGLIRTHGLYSPRNNTSFRKISQSIAARFTWNFTCASAPVKFQSDWTTKPRRQDFASSCDDKFNIWCRHQKQENRVNFVQILVFMWMLIISLIWFPGAQA